MSSHLTPGITAMGTVSTIVAGFFVNVDQRNGSANSGGALTSCLATVTSEFVAPVATPEPTATATAESAASSTADPTPSATGTPTTAAAPLPAGTGNAGLLEGSGASTAVVVPLVRVAALTLPFVGRRMTLSRRVR